ncbi:MAG: hypothetical protein WC278_01570 [Bacilli bacterium]|nr:hypothetical protein [Bacilli bacterium]
MKKFEFVELWKVALCYGLIVFGMFLCLLGNSISRFGVLTSVEIALLIGIIGFLLYSFAKNEHYYTFFAILGLFVFASIANLGSDIVIAIITSVVVIGAVLVSFNYFMFGNMKYILVGLVGALTVLTFVNAILAFSNINAGVGILYLGIVISLVGALLIPLLVRSHLEKKPICCHYSTNTNKKKEVIELETKEAESEI